jgi:response regulator RpfG family c-di-GMP phosphodiesterase
VSDEQQNLTRIINLGLEVAEVKDVDLLLERILTEARHLSGADAGSIYVKENDNLRFTVCQNDTLCKKLPNGKKLVYSTFSVPIDNDSIAGYVANTGVVLNIPDVYSLDKKVPYSFDEQYDEMTRYRTKSMLTCPLKTNRGEIIGVLQLINSQDENGNIVAFKRDDEPLIMHFANNAAIALQRAQLTRAIILRMIKMSELRDPKETGAHVNRVASYSMEIYENWASKRGIPGSEIEDNKDILKIAAMLHDVGKVAISDVILKKPAKLDLDEVAIMKQHTYMGARLFTNPFSDFDEAALIVALSHHERWDGTGYPGHINPMTGRPIPGYERGSGTAMGKKGDEIPPFGRVVAIADVYDALSCKRVYKEAWDESRVLDTIRKESGHQFDPDMVDAFFEVMDVIKSIQERYPDE